jgi:hypothetical protein
MAHIKFYLYQLNKIVIITSIFFLFNEKLQHIFALRGLDIV